MKEFPNYEYDGKSYDLCFYDETVQIYSVENKFSGMMVSQLILADNDYVAIKGFKNLIDKNKEKGDTQVYSLIRLGTLNHQKINICDIERIELIDSRADLEKWLHDSEEFMSSLSDEE